MCFWVTQTQQRLLQPSLTKLKSLTKLDKHARHSVLHLPTGNAVFTVSVVRIWAQYRAVCARPQAPPPPQPMMLSLAALHPPHLKVGSTFPTPGIWPLASSPGPVASQGLDNGQPILRNGVISLTLDVLGSPGRSADPTNCALLRWLSHRIPSWVNSSCLSQCAGGGGGVTQQGMTEYRHSFSVNNSYHILLGKGT